MFKVGDKVYYIGKVDSLNKNKIFTVSYATEGFICISDLEELRKTTQSIPLWEDYFFINIVDFRKQKINKIKYIINENRKHKKIKNV